MNRVHHKQRLSTAWRPQAYLAGQVRSVLRALGGPTGPSGTAWGGTAAVAVVVVVAGG